nr:cytochrome b [Pseudocohnilembus persalinus]
MEWNRGSYYNLGIRSIYHYFAVLAVSFHDIHSLFGFFTFLTVASQLVSGTMLAFSLVPEPMIVPIVRDEEDIEDLYTDDFFWLHERGVDLIFIFSYIHLFRKLYLNVFEYENEAAWKSGVFTFLIFQVTVFFGLVLCCTHLSEITLTIAANIFHTFFDFKGKFYWWIFTDKQLNTDTMIRLAYGHYLIAFYMAYLGLIHGVDMHYDWKNETTFDGLDTEMVWWDEALSSELGHMADVLVIVTIAAWFLYGEPEALSYEIFMWGDIGIVTDVRFYGVAPHWYFRPFMAWLIACPYHRTGIFGLLFYFLVLFYQPALHGTTEQNNYNKKVLLFAKQKLNRYNMFVASYFNLEMNIYHQMTYGLFIGCCLYVTSFLPYGRFYNKLGGNIGLIYAYMYVFCYLGFTVFRRPVILELFFYFLYSRVNFLKNTTNAIRV